METMATKKCPPSPPTKSITVLRRDLLQGSHSTLLRGGFREGGTSRPEVITKVDQENHQRLINNKGAMYCYVMFNSYVTKYPTS